MIEWIALAVSLTSAGFCAFTMRVPRNAGAFKLIQAPVDLKQQEIDAGIRCEHDAYKDECATCTCPGAEDGKHTWKRGGMRWIKPPMTPGETLGRTLMSSERYRTVTEGYTVITFACQNPECNQTKQERHDGKLMLPGVKWADNAANWGCTP